MAEIRNIVVVTGSRAEFGLLEPVMRAVARRRGLALRVVVTGMHLVTGTWRDVIDAGFTIAARVPIQRRGKSGRSADVEALGRGVIGLGKSFVRLRPDVVLVLGDRIEALAGALAGSVGGFRMGHIHGGDRAEGVADEAMRHAISKLAHVHFPATATSRKRLIRMGEHPGVVFNVGSPAIDGLAGVRAHKHAPSLIVIQHPIGASDAQEARWMTQTITAIKRMERRLAGRAWYLAPNADPGSTGILRALRDAGITPTLHVPRGVFLSTLAGARAIVGNSSAGLIEASALGAGVPCVNIGPRQAGRERPGNVIDCDYGTAGVSSALSKALELGRRRFAHPFGAGHAGTRLAEILASLDLAKVPLRKRNAY